MPRWFILLFGAALVLWLGFTGYILWAVLDTPNPRVVFGQWLVWAVAPVIVGGIVADACWKRKRGD